MIIYIVETVLSTLFINAFLVISKTKIIMIKSFFDCYFCCNVDKLDVYVI